MMGRSLILSTVTLLTAAQNPSSNAFLAFTKNDPLAVCLDGSPAAYYYRPGAESKKFYIHTQGGGYETSNDAFYARSLTDLGSSKNYPAVSAQGSGYFSTDPKINPLMHNWTLLYMPYCDGTFQTSFVPNPVHTSKGVIYHRGDRIVRAAIAEFSTNATIGLSQATDVVISGCSAGGVSTFLHVDLWAAAFPRAKMAALPDSGFVLNYGGGGGSTRNFTREMMTMVALVNASAATLPSACVAAHPDRPEMCIFPEEVSLTLKTPCFPLQAQYDQWQVENELPNTTASTVNWYGGVLRSRLESNLLGPNRPHGVFLDSCYHHCGDVYNSVTVGKDHQSTAFLQWYTQLGQAGARKEWYQNATYPCAACCSPQ